MKYQFHIISNSFYPVMGGLQLSIIRLTKILNLLYDSPIINFYVLRTKFEQIPVNLLTSNVHLHYLEADIIKVAEPILLKNKLTKIQHFLKKKLRPNVSLDSMDSEERTRMQYLVLKQKIHQKLANAPKEENNHILISYYLTKGSFIGQYIASYFDLPHIASVRGTDFNVDYFNPSGLSIYNFVVNNAAHIITTNKYQEKILKKSFPIQQDKISTVYNSVKESPSLWSFKSKKEITIITDCGLSHKKGTHLLFKVLEDILKDNQNVKFIIAGAIEKPVKYWENLLQNLKTKYPNRFNYSGFLLKKDIKTFLLAGDFYVSASFGEGCSNARLLAYTLGMPIVTTLTGEMNEIVEKENVLLVPVADEELLKNAIEAMIRKFENREIKIDKLLVEQRKKTFSFEKEVAKWKGIINSLNLIEKEQKSPIDNSVELLRIME